VKYATKEAKNITIVFIFTFRTQKTHPLQLEWKQKTRGKKEK